MGQSWYYSVFSFVGDDVHRRFDVGLDWEVILSILSPAFFPCPECGKLSKCLEVRKRTSSEGTWKYRRYECSSEHKFSTAEQVYKPVQGRQPKFVQEGFKDD